MKKTEKDIFNIQTLGELKKSGYKSKTIRQELRDNLLEKIQAGENSFPEMMGYQHTVIPQLENALLAGHNILFLGLRGQGKSKMASLIPRLLDEYVPKLPGFEMCEDPFNPITDKAKKMVQEMGENCPIEWIKRDQRFSEKLATPDVNMSDLIGDIDPIKAANLKLDLSNPEVIRLGIIPKMNRGIFLLNEIPDLQPRLQVALFNLLQEGFLQIRGFKLQLPVDILFIFTANPEDYTNRGSIITPLKDRIGSQILTHYPSDRNVSKKISESQSQLVSDDSYLPELMKDLIEQLAMEARESEFIDASSGVSARLSISCWETISAQILRRNTLNKEDHWCRVSDISLCIPAITGKVEMVYEGQQEGITSVVHRLIGSAIRKLALEQFPIFQQIHSKKGNEVKKDIEEILRWFETHTLTLSHDMSYSQYTKALDQITNLKKYVAGRRGSKDSSQLYLYMEFFIHALAEFSLISKSWLDGKQQYSDVLNSMLSLDSFED